MNLLKFGMPLPPLPLKEARVSSLISLAPLDRAGSFKKSLATILASDDEAPANPSDASSNLALNTIKQTRKVMNDRREGSIQEFLKKAQIDSGSTSNLFSPSPYVKNLLPYTSRFRYTPTMNLEHSEADDQDGESLYKVEMRGYRIPIPSLEALHSVSHSMANLTHLT